MTGLAACDLIHDDSIAPCEYRLRFVYDYNMKFADAFQKEVDKAALFICDDKGNFIQRRDIEGAELKANNIVMDLAPSTYQVLTWAGTGQPLLRVARTDTRNVLLGRDPREDTTRRRRYPTQ